LLSDALFGAPVPKEVAMIIRTLAAGVALAVLVSGAASAAPQAKASTAPKQPIPYSQLDAYLKASPKARASTDWWSGSASTGASADTSATVPSTDSPAAPTMPTDGAVNPPATTMPSDSSASMPATPPTMPEATTPAPGSNLPTSAATPGAPTEPK
jgi:molybdate transport system ATP-binding protein